MLNLLFGSKLKRSIVIVFCFFVFAFIYAVNSYDDWGIILLFSFGFAFMTALTQYGLRRGISSPLVRGDNVDEPKDDFEELVQKRRKEKK